MAVIAKNLGWTDNTHYGDTDYGLGQVFTQGKFRINLQWAPDGRQGIGDELIGVSVYDIGYQPVDRVVFHVEGRDQTHMRAAATEALNYYAVNLVKED
jgi:hypothetical protein